MAERRAYCVGWGVIRTRGGEMVVEERRRKVVLLGGTHTTSRKGGDAKPSASPQYCLGEESMHDAEYRTPPVSFCRSQSQDQVSKCMLARDRLRTLSIFSLAAQPRDEYCTEHYGICPCLSPVQEFVRLCCGNIQGNIQAW